VGEDRIRVCGRRIGTLPGSNAAGARLLFRVAGDDGIRG